MKTSLLIFFLIQQTVPQTLSPVADLKTLSELPLEKLLQVRSSFDTEENKIKTEQPLSVKLRIREDNPQALPLKQPLRKSTHEDVYYEKEKKSIFAISVTGLAFAAFGGYLLCLIVSALKHKHHDMMPAPANMTIAYIRPIRPNRIRPQRQKKKPQRFPRVKRNDARDDEELMFEEIQKDPIRFQEEMYESLVMFAEGYRKYHTVDRSFTNNTYV